MARVSKENSALAEELERLKAARAVTNTVIPGSIPEEPKGGDVVVEKPTRQQVLQGSMIEPKYYSKYCNFSRQTTRRGSRECGSAPGEIFPVRFPFENLSGDHRPSEGPMHN